MRIQFLTTVTFGNGHHPKMTHWHQWDPVLSTLMHIHSSTLSVHGTIQWEQYYYYYYEVKVVYCIIWQNAGWGRTTLERTTLRFPILSVAVMMSRFSWSSQALPGRKFPRLRTEFLSLSTSSFWVFVFSLLLRARLLVRLIQVQWSEDSVDLNTLDSSTHHSCVRLLESNHLAKENTKTLVVAIDLQIVQTISWL